MALQLRKDAEASLFAEVSVLLRNIADAWDPDDGGNDAEEQRISKTLLKNAARLSRELDKYTVAP